MTHTPTWYATDNLVREYASDAVVAQISDGGHLNDDIEIFDAAEREKHARLIAAVPKLLEAVRCAEAQLRADHDPEIAAEMFGGESDPARAMHINRYNVAEMCNAAIAKATGTDQ